jgi:hypothetical protein
MQSLEAISSLIAPAIPGIGEAIDIIAVSTAAIKLAILLAPYVKEGFVTIDGETIKLVKSLSPIEMSIIKEIHKTL